MNKPLRIAFITPEFVSEKYFSGGLANYTYRVAKFLAELGHDVHVVVHASADEDTVFDGMTLHRVAPCKAWSLLNVVALGRLWKTSRCLGFAWAAHKKLAGMWRRKELDVVQIANMDACGLFAVLFNLYPHVTFVAGYSPLWNKLAGMRRNVDVRVVEALERIQVQKTRVVHVPTAVVTNLIHRKARAGHVTQVIRTPFFTEVGRMDASVYKNCLKGKAYLLYFGRLQAHKGVQILADALPAVLEAAPDAYAVFVGADRPYHGGASMRHYIESKCGRFAGRIVFIPEIRHEQLYPVLDGAKLVVLPSLIDNLPNTLLESLSRGKPVIGTIGASFDEIIVDGESGFLVERGDSAGLADKIVRAWSHPDLTAIGEGAKRAARAFDPEVTVSQHLDLYRRVMDVSE